MTATIATKNVAGISGATIAMTAMKIATATSTGVAITVLIMTTVARLTITTARSLIRVAARQG